MYNTENQTNKTNLRKINNIKRMFAKIVHKCKKKS